MSAAYPRKKVLTSVHLRPEQHATLETIRENTGVPVAVLIRQGVDAVIAMHRAANRKGPNQVPIWAPCCGAPRTHDALDGSVRYYCDCAEKNAPGHGNPRAAPAEGMATDHTEPSAPTCQEGGVPR